MFIVFYGYERNINIQILTQSYEKNLTFANIFAKKMRKKGKKCNFSAKVGCSGFFRSLFP